MAYTKYSLTPASNTAAPPDGAPEGMLPSAVNDTMRDMMSQIRDCGDGIRNGTYTMTAPVITGGSVTGVTFSSSSATITGGSVTGVTFSSSSATITGGSVTGITDLTVADGGTGASTVAAAQTNLQVFNFKNRIINGDMRIDQRNAGASSSVINTYTVDRWVYYASQSGKLGWQQNSGGVTPPVGFNNYLGFASASAYSVTSSDYFLLRQPIEGFNTADLGWGTANAKTVTLSFWVRSSLTGTFGGSLRNNAANRSYPFTYTINSANTWELKTITIAGDTSGTWVGATNGIGLNVTFSLGAGTTQSGTAGAWASADYNSATGATSVVGTNGATFYITGVQLEVGSSASNFEYVDITTQTAMCQRYFVKSNPDNGSRCGGSWGSMYSTGSAALNGNLPITMRTPPTFARGGTSDTFYISGINATSTGSTSLFSSTTSWYSYEVSSLATAVLGNPVIYNGQASFSAEL